MTQYTVFKINGVVVACLTTINTLLVLWEYQYHDELQQLMGEYPTEFVDSFDIPL